MGIDINNFISNNYYLKTTQATETNEWLQKREARFQKGKWPKPMPVTVFRAKNETVSRQDLVISCVIQTALLVLSLGVNGGFIALNPQASLAAVPAALKSGVVSGLLMFGAKKVLDVALKKFNVPLLNHFIAPTPELPILKDWKDHFTLLAAYTPSGKWNYVKGALKSMLFNAVYLGLATRFWSATAASDQIANGITSYLTKKFAATAYRMGEHRFYKGSPQA